MTFLCVGLHQKSDAVNLETLSSIGTTPSWDAYGVYALDSDGPMSQHGLRILRYLHQSERGRAETLARYRLKVDKNDLIPAWALARIARAKGNAIEEYERNVRPFVNEEASVPTMLYRYSICNFAVATYARIGWPNHQTYAALSENIRSLSDRCRPAATRKLGVAITLVREAALWDRTHREILEDYRSRNVKGVDVRPLICRAYLGGKLTAWVEEEGKKRRVPEKEAMASPDAPQPSKVLEIAREILRERPDDPLGLYYRGRGFWALGQGPAAFRDMRSALDTGKLPPLMRQAAAAFLAKPSDAAFSILLPVG